MTTSFLTRSKEIYEVQNFKEFYSRVFSGKLSPFVAAACVNTRITPNHLTFFLSGTNLGFFIGGLLLILLNILDAADGELARYTKQTSDFGDYLDRVAHYSTNSPALVGLGLGLYFQTEFFWLLPLSLFGCLAIIADDAVRDLLVTCGLQTLDDDSGSRKTLKSKTRISAFGSISHLAQNLFSNVAFFHIVPLIAVLQIFVFKHSFLMPVYFLGFCGFTITKFLMRSRTIYNSFGK